MFRAFELERHLAVDGFGKPRNILDMQGTLTRVGKYGSMRRIETDLVPENMGGKIPLVIGAHACRRPTHCSRFVLQWHVMIVVAETY